jgi:sugar phosphate isomerase/epimerase
VTGSKSEEGKPFRYCLNTSTIRGQALALPEEVDLAARAGYDGIEAWIREMDAHAAVGRALEDVGKRVCDLGLSVESAIGFFEWVVDDDALRLRGMEEARRNMEMCQRIGCARLAAPPFGATGLEGLDLGAAARRYRELMELGDAFGVTPVVEFWGVSKSLSRLSEAVFVALESGRPDACVLADVFHMFKGGSPYEGFRLLGPRTLALLHLNDFPAGRPHETLTDADRVYPGDGAAPLARILRDLHEAGWAGTLSLELFNESYWRRDALAVARTGLEKMQACVEAALSGA